MTFPNGYDVNLEADRIKLRDEELGTFDATSALMGYGDVTGQTKKTLGLFNDPELNVGGETTATTLTPTVLRNVVVVDDLSANQVTDGDRLWLGGFIHGVDPNENLDAWRAKIRQAFKLNSDTVAAIDALQRVLSRAEVLFGQGTVISQNDWFAARDQP